MKVAVRGIILKKPSSLSCDEKLVMRQHTVLGARLFKRANSFWDYRPQRPPWITTRHGMAADVDNALISQRACKKEWRQERALRYIRYQAGRKYDPELVSLFLKMDELRRGWTVRGENRGTDPARRSPVLLLPRAARDRQVLRRQGRNRQGRHVRPGLADRVAPDPYRR